MRRLEFIALLSSSAAVWPLTVHAQQGERVRRIAKVIAEATDWRFLNELKRELKG